MMTVRQADGGKLSPQIICTLKTDALLMFREHYKILNIRVRESHRHTSVMKRRAFVWLLLILALYLRIYFHLQIVKQSNLKSNL